MLYPEHGILFSSKEKWDIKPQEDFEESKTYIIKWKKSVWKANEHTGWLQLYDIWSSVLIGGGQEGMNRQSSGDI